MNSLAGMSLTVKKVCYFSPSIDGEKILKNIINIHLLSKHFISLDRK